MNKSTIGIIAAVAAIVLWGVSAYNGIVGLDENCNKAWGNVESQYQRRLDLIPNLVETVKGYANHEENTLKEVVEARAKATSITIDPSNITPEQLAEFQQAQAGVSSALGKLLAVAEAYPDLKANQNFLELQSQLEGTENRIATERMRYNETVQTYNTKIRSVPTNFVAMFGSFQPRSMFEAEAGAEKAPKVSF